MRLLSYNIRYGGRGRERALADVIAASNPDVVVLQEATDPVAVKRVADHIGFGAFGARAGESVGYLARATPRAADWRRLPGARHAFLDLQPADTRWRVIGVHLRAMHANWAERRRVADAQALVRTIAAGEIGPHVMAGDFNTLPPGDELELDRLPLRIRAIVWMSGRRVTWRVVQALLEAGYADAWVASGARLPGVTFPSWGPHLRLDYAFVPEALRATVRACRPVGESPEARRASDHLPLFVELDEPTT